MKIKHFEATNMKEALEKIKQEMGPDAFILGTKSIKKKGPLGFGERTFLQVTAALDEKQAPSVQVTQEPEKPQWEPPKKLTQPAAASASASASPTYNQKGKPQVAVEDSFSEGFDTVFARSRQAARVKAAQEKPREAEEGSDNQRPLRKEISELKDLVQSMKAPRSEALEKELVELKNLLFNVVKHQNQLHLKNQTPALIQVYNRLMENGMEASLAAKLVQLSEERLQPRQLNQVERVENMVHSLISKALEVAVPKGPKRIVALVGPTGVGKTTTLAKLAAHHALQDKGTVAFITLDTYRIAAVDQLKTYAHIMDIPLQVALNPAELAQAIQFHENKSLILIDTAGYSHHDKASMTNLLQFFKGRQDIEIHLVLSATTKGNDLTDIIHNFEALSPRHFILTKLDETSSYGPLFTQLIRFKKSVSYLTVGQSVPEDIAFPSKDYLADLFMGRTPYGKGVRQA
ncbi:MAG: flagellar biosynthesis protein FlhF [Acidobacteria bacterium]|nr:flagellar biosynthesis protein FlhF [Acidobacteriota bacterium]